MLKKQKYLTLKKKLRFFFSWLELAQNGALIKGHQSLFQVPKKAEQNMTKNNYRITEKNFKKNRIC